MQYKIKSLKKAAVIKVVSNKIVDSIYSVCTFAWLCAQCFTGIISLGPMETH